MTIFYVDLVNGNDANTGLSWAQAWKTSLNGPTAARTVPGDTFRFAKSPDPTSVGTATWTSGKVGNSITFSSAPTKQIDLCQTGWVTMGAGAVVTNNQATAFILGTPGTPGTGSALQVVTTASANGAYKALGSTVDFSAHQQVCFWFRTTVAFDCTGAQNLTVRLCSDTAGVTVVDSLVMPKWTYSANVWYPIVINKGSALGSSIQSVSYMTTSNTSQTFYFAEMFASPSSGITLWSLIGKYTSSATEEYDWFPIKSIRDADVWLHGALTLGTAAGACGANAIDPSYIGTTETVTTYKRETIKPQATSGPGAVAFLSTNEAGTVTTTTASLYTWSGGWNTGTTVQDGETWTDNLAQLGLGISLGHNYNQFEKFGLVRNSTAISGASFTSMVDISLVGNTNYSLSAAAFDLRKQINVAWNFKCIHAHASQLGIILSNTVPGSKINIGNCWGGYSYLQVSGALLTNFNIGNISPVAAVQQALSTTGILNSTVNIGAVEPCRTTGYPLSQPVNQVYLSNNDAFSTMNITSLNSPSTTASAACLGIGNTCNTVFNVGDFIGGGVAVTPTALNDSVINGGNINTVYGAYYPGSSTVIPAMCQAIFHNYNNTPGLSRIYRSQQSSTPLYWELQGTDVRTGGSKAWKISITGISTGALGNVADVMGIKNNLKLASVAAVAGSLVTVDCYVKRTSANQDVGIYVDAASKFLPGYTVDIVDTCSSSGAFELLTVTFTPTEDCVFDVYAFVTYTSTNSVDCVWDDLSITQA